MTIKIESAATTQTDRAHTTPATIKRPPGGMFRALAEPNYRTYLAGSFVSNIGTWMQRVAQAGTGAFRRLRHSARHYNGTAVPADAAALSVRRSHCRSLQ
jgi:hypothetical protein